MAFEEKSGRAFHVFACALLCSIKRLASYSATVNLEDGQVNECVPKQTSLPLFQFSFHFPVVVQRAAAAVLILVKFYIYPILFIFFLIAILVS